MKYIDRVVLEDFKNWLVSSQNPDFSGDEKYSGYDYYINRLFEKAVELNVITESEIKYKDVVWLREFQKIYESSSRLREVDRTRIGHLGGIAALKKFINFIEYKNKVNQNITVIAERKELFRKYLNDCGKCNERAGEGVHANTLDGYWFGLSRKLINDEINEPFSYDDEVAFEPIKKKIMELDKGGDPSQGAKWYSKFLAECKFKKLLEWFVTQLRINNEIIDGIKTQGKGADKDKIRKHYECWRAYIGFELDCTLRCDYAKAMSGANYIHLTHTWLNIVPEFVQSSNNFDVMTLKIVYKPNNHIERAYDPVTILQLGLFDGRFPNEKLRNLFNDFKKEINKVQQGAHNLEANKEEDKTMRDGKDNKFELNLILYGPPGTGKTYNTVIRAVKIIENENFIDDGYDNIKARYDKYLEKGRIAFTTFHQSYGYEEFIEGIKPDIEADEIKYKRTDGIFKEFCDKAVGFRFLFNFNSDHEFKNDVTVWKVSLGGAGKNNTRDECMKNSQIRIGWDDYGEFISEDTNFSGGGERILNAFINDMNIGDIVLSCYSTTEIDAVGVIDGEYEWHNEYPHYKRVRKVKWLVKGIKEDITQLNNGKRMMQPSVYRLDISPDEIAKFLNELQKPDVKLEYKYDDNYVFIIDEINRGNVSKIFGELITLIEPIKRLGEKEEMTCKLPYSGKTFGVPKNVYILGTMNTADRSLVQLDAALRRRFAFEEMMPNPELLNVTDDGIDLRKLITAINERVTALLDREHQIGHSYFIGVSNVQQLAYVFKQRIIPLLQEYFFDDYELVGKVLSEAFVKEKINPFNNGKILYEIVCPDEVNKYQSIYSGTNTNSLQTNE